MTRWKAIAATAAVVLLGFLFVPVRYTEVCGFERGGFFFPRGPCYKQFENLAGMAVHPILSIFLGLTLLVLAFVWLLRKPSPRVINRIMEGKGVFFVLGRAFLFVCLGAFLISLFFVAPLWILERIDAPGPSWFEWMSLALVVGLWFFLVAFGPNKVGGKPWRGSRQPSALLGPDREPPPDSRRY